jgi:vancomycin resistance protein YoaR
MSQPVHNRPRQMPPPRPKKSHSTLTAWLVRLPLLMFMGAILLTIVLAIFLTAFQIRIQDRIVPGVSVAGIDLSGMTHEEAVAALANQYTYANEAIFTFRDGDDIWQMSAEDLGVTFDVDETVIRAYLVGHKPDTIRSLSEQARTWFTGKSVPPIVTYNQTVAQTFFEEIATEIDSEPLDATLSVDGLTVSTTRGQTGRKLNVAATLADLNNVLLAFDSGSEIPLAINETPPIVWNVDEAANSIRAALSGSIELTATDINGQQLGPWTVSQDQIASLLSVTLQDNLDGTRSYDVSISLEAFSGFLETLAPGLITPASDGRFNFDPNTRELIVVAPSSSGRELNVTDTIVRLEEAVFTNDGRIVPMAFNYTLPRYHNQSSAIELGITELVAESTTYFTGSDNNRRTNIAVGASKLDGVIIAPGEEFSFNYLLGEIEPESGFVDGKVIFGGRTVTGIGGGICQVSTTVFRAAFEGGFAITERNSHGYRVGYYELNSTPPGLDAAIWQPERDFRFQNNTPYHLLIETDIIPAQDAIQFRFYSTRHWRTEIEEAIIKDEISAPANKFISNKDLQPGEIRQVDYSADGADVTVYRNIYDLSGELVTRDYEFTHYLPWQAIFEVAPNDSRLAQGS